MIGSAHATATMIALAMPLPTLPLLLLAYVWLWLRARRMPAECSLRRSEAAELGRALGLYEKACRRLKQIDDQFRERQNLWRLFFTAGPEITRDAADERADLDAHAVHLRAVIGWLRRMPLQRLQAWVRMMSLRWAFGWALALLLVLLAVFMALLRLLDQFATAQDLLLATETSLLGLSSEQEWMLANIAAASLSVTSMPLFYLSRRAALRCEFSLEFCLLKELAKAGAERKSAQEDIAGGPWGELEPAEPIHAEGWFTTLGVAETASLDEVKEAYKLLIKQTHPDRLHAVSPAIRQFAEAQTKRLNAAYEKALAALE